MKSCPGGSIPRTRRGLLADHLPSAANGEVLFGDMT